jgi:hypothetical protein
VSLADGCFLQEVAVGGLSPLALDFLHRHMPLFALRWAAKLDLEAAEVKVANDVTPATVRRGPTLSIHPNIVALGWWRGRSVCVRVCACMYVRAHTRARVWVCRCGRVC